MSVEFSICGGKLKILKKMFIKEMLKASSSLKTLLNYELEDGEKKRNLHIDKSSDKDYIIIDYNYTNNVHVGEDYRNLLYELKKRYKSNIQGNIILSSEYMSFGMNIELDLNSEDGEVKVVH